MLLEFLQILLCYQFTECKVLAFLIFSPRCSHTAIPCLQILIFSESESDCSRGISNDNFLPSETSKGLLTSTLNFIMHVIACMSATVPSFPNLMTSILDSIVVPWVGITFSIVIVLKLHFVPNYTFLISPQCVKAIDAFSSSFLIKSNQ